MSHRIAACAAVVLLLAACSSGPAASPTAAPEHIHSDATSLGRPDEPIAGPQGAVPQFLVECTYSHAASDDPIVFPGVPGASHLHMFFGNGSTNAHTTVESLAQGNTTCDQQLDKAAYWAPALLKGSYVLTPVKSTAYYRAGLHVDPASVQPFPKGLVMVAGSAGATAPQPNSIVAWTCGSSSIRDVLPPECVGDRNLRLVVTFPDCWDGAHLDSADHHHHVAYSSKGVCPEGYPVSVPQLQFAVEYPVTGPVAGLELSSGGLLTGHADFMNGWNERKLTEEVDLCLHRKVVCGVTSGRKTG
ncbi:MAG: DUF1996 domain-containing protein [Actinomycetota bacterium]